MAELEEEIEGFVVGTEGRVWEEWYEQVKAGKIVIPDDDYRGEVEKGEGA